MSGGQKIRGPHTAVHQALGVDIGKRVEGRLEHVPHLGGGEGTLRKHLRQVLVRAFHHNVEEFGIAQLATSCLEQPDQVPMRQAGCRLPSRNLVCRIVRIGRDKLDDGCWDGIVGGHSRKDGAPFAAAQVLQQRKSPIDDLPLPLLTVFDHR